MMEQFSAKDKVQFRKPQVYSASAAAMFSPVGRLRCSKDERPGYKHM